MRELRERAGLVDGLEKENWGLRAALDAALGQLDANPAKTRPKAGNGEDGAANRSLGTQTIPNFPDEKDVDGNISHERLLQKHNILIGSYQELVLARKQLENKLRSCQKSNREWVEYANGLEKKIGRLQGKLTSHGIPLKRRSEGSSAPKTLPDVPSSSRELERVTTTDASLETLRRELPNLLHMSERISELARNAAVGTSVFVSPYPPQSTSTDRSEQEREDSESIDTPIILLKELSELPHDPTASGRQVSRVSPYLLTSLEAISQRHTENPVSSESHDSGTTKEDIDVLPNIFNREQVDIPPIIKAEPLSDIPVVISFRSVKKRKTRGDAGSNESASNTKIKVEIVTSSPIGLAGLQNLFPPESMDLDEIGEKMNTPKKRRQAIQNLHLENGQTAYKRLPAELVQAVGPQRGERNAQLKRKPSALQPASPNKQILPRTSAKERETKRRRLEDRMRGAEIFGEDGENDVTPKVVSQIEASTESPRKRLPANAVELKRRLTGLLEEPSPDKEVLTPMRRSIFPTTTAQFRARATPADKCERPIASTRRQVGAGTTPNTLAISRDTPKTDHKPSTVKKRISRTPGDSGLFERTGSDQEPLRARPIRLLGLEHFKVNPHFNQGSDYAFADVVRGRELRRCLPGCTKPECCGDKFRKFIEFTRAHEQQTLSQEEEDERLLEEYLGYNKGRLQKMTQKEREELLVQARTRNLANKTSKHRHAYERRRSPPGFWRSDFPSTQELETDRLEAANRERELVQQRYEEAMRPGGRWLFRDE
jgi:hypothetical protein